MNVEPFNWDVVIVGYWNRAILTPNGIAKRLFKLAEGTGIQVAIPVNLFEPAQIEHDGIVVRVEERRLIIATENPSYESLNNAMQTGCNALRDLPETPVFAAGFNIRFKISDHALEFDQIAQSLLDTQLSDAGYEIISRGLIRRIRVKGSIFEKGVANVLVHKKEDSAVRIELNFHRDSNSVTDLTEWLNVSAANLQAEVKKILKSMSLNIEEIEDE